MSILKELTPQDTDRIINRINRSMAAVCFSILADEILSDDLLPVPKPNKKHINLIGLTWVEPDKIQGINK